MAEKLYALNDEQRAMLLELFDQFAKTTGFQLTPEPERISQSADCYIASVGGDGIPARSGTTPGSATCTIYKVKASGLLGTCGFTAKVYNLSESEVGEGYITIIRDKYGKWLAQTGGGGADSTKIVKVTGPINESGCYYPGTVESASELTSLCTDPFDTHTYCHIVVLNSDGGTISVGSGTATRVEPTVGDRYIGQKISNLGTGTGTGTGTHDSNPVYAIRVDQGGGGVLWYVGSLGSDLSPSDLTFTASLAALDGSGSIGSQTVNNPLHTGGSSGDAIYVVQNDTGETTEYDLVRVALHECT